MIEKSVISLPATAIFAGVVIAASLSSAQTVHTEAYQLGRTIRDGAQRGDVSAVVQAFDVDAFINRIVNPLRVPDSIRQAMRQHIQGRASARDFAEAFGRSGNDFAFIGVRRFNGEYHLLFRCHTAKNTYAYYSFPLGRTALGATTLVDFYCFAPGEYGSDTARRNCLAVLGTMGPTATAELEQKHKDLIAAQVLCNKFVEQCGAEQYNLAIETYRKLPESVQTDHYVLFNLARVAIHKPENVFLETIAPWRRAYRNDPTLEMFVSDYYWEKGETAKAIPAFERLNAALEGDASVDLRLAKLHDDLGQTKEAKACLWQAARRDPPDTNAFSFLLKRTLADKNFDETAQALALQESMFDVDLKPAVKSDATYAEFRKSPSYQKWLQAPRERQKTPMALAANSHAGSDALKLQGILFGGAHPSAMINGQSVFVGDKVGTYQVTKIEARNVTLQSTAGDVKTLALREAQ